MTSYNQRIVLTRPVFDGNEKEAIIEPLETGWLVQGPRVAEFEKSVCKYTGAKFAKAASSCTTALHMALLVLDIGPGDEVLLPSFTYVATANVVEYVGARPVFIDIDLKTFNIDCCVIEDYLQEKLKGSAFSDSYRTKAIIPVHLF
ncbi:MAG: aminotransferase class I/II-fold pyridoxal phosphate-dependent enzyme, partial [Thermodesulfobacteriota bacterium]|nr:aminotransferase class I/II-fold pyridoxal phosphate-dependent enzyme [Thermodesulfobacteriota bacterium]